MCAATGFKSQPGGHTTIERKARIMKKLFHSTPFKAVIGATALAALAACGGGDDSGGQGTLRLAMTDAPACGFDAVNVTVERVRVHQSSTAAPEADGWSDLVLDPPQRLNLLDLTNGVLSELGQWPLDAGSYQQLRLVLGANDDRTPLANSVRPSGGTEVALKTPSGQQSGVKMNANIDIAANQMTDFVLDFDACKSVVSAGASEQYLLKPVVQVIPRLISGVGGHVDAALFDAGAVISLQQNGAVIRSTVPDATGRFLLQPAPSGSYSVVFTAPARTTMVINNVPVVTDQVTTISTPITMQASPVVTVQGTAPINTLVRALQPLTSGPTIEVAGRYVDGTTGTYDFTLPTNAPLVAAYVAPPAALNFTPDVAAAGRYSVRASLDGHADKATELLTLPAGSSVQANFTFP